MGHWPFPYSIETKRRESKISLGASDPVRLLTPVAHDGVALRCAVVPCAEPFIERHRPISTVVAFKVPVVEVVEIALSDGGTRPVFLHPLVIADMAHRRCKAGCLHVEYDMKRMGQQDPMQ